ncbi:DNA/RNA non-specific endonuclease [Lentilactobacillus sp. SPB1-3]|uniref:DNA/RNA non-specific endonuclease n=1 Tax=Lentilactobacillus terminaliae TaxID=3003483 RepID=A0ACD5DEU8_9LACO|nr:DNA/RNA non-specific endonuclease [Lentilactobacillus sp. SPB1-3]MCZ0977544.1 DNA/RNA non-specific endonuclease [Lentilactobacillus sp. SPB1-3]
MAKKRNSYRKRTTQGTLGAIVILIIVWLLNGMPGGDLFNNSSTEQANRASVESTSKLANLTFKSGDDSVVYINHDHATLNPNDWQTNKVDYQNLDSYNRTSNANVAYLENSNLASDSNRQRQYVKPTAWHQKFVDGDPIINRGHLIAYSLSGGINSDGQYTHTNVGDQNNPKNLFTQTAFSNQKIQTIYEQKVRQALYDHKRVIFYARPIFRGSELMARGIHLQAVSTDKSLDFNVYLFNVQPKVQFDYQTGRSTIDRNFKVAEPTN